MSNVKCVLAWKEVVWPPWEADVCAPPGPATAVELTEPATKYNLGRMT